MANMIPISTVTVGSGGAATINFTSIPQTYTDLCIKLSTRSTSTAGSNWAAINVKPNGSLSSSNRVLYGTGSASGSYSGSSGSGYVSVWGTSSAVTSNTFANVEIYIPNYTSSNYKSISNDTVTENNATSALAAMVAMLYESTSPITSLILESASGEGNFAQYSTATLYGIRKY